jgi:hypothetical protein
LGSGEEEGAEEVNVLLSCGEGGRVFLHDQWGLPWPLHTDVGFQAPELPSVIRSRNSPRSLSGTSKGPNPTGGGKDSDDFPEREREEWEDPVWWRSSETVHLLLAFVAFSQAPSALLCGCRREGQRHSCSVGQLVSLLSL